MATNAPIKFQNGSLPEGFCFTNWQTLFNTFTGLLGGHLPGEYNTFNYGNTEPTAENRSKPWLRLNANGSPDKWYVYFGGEWIWPHPVEVGGSEIRIWNGLLADVPTYDGGSVGAVSDTTGPMWEEDTSMRALFPLGAGTLESGTVVGAGDTGGEEKHVLTEAELAAHAHYGFATGLGSGAVGAATASTRRDLGDNSNYAIGAISGEADAGLGQEVGDDTAHNNMPPYRGVIFIKRTARKFYTP